jgi:hypothetical protein
LAQFDVSEALMSDWKELGSEAGSSSYDDVVAVLDANKYASFGDLATLADSLAAKCRELAGVLRSSSVRTQVETYTRLDSEAVLQESHLMHELTTANICLMVTGVLSGLVLVAAKVGLPVGFATVQNVTLAIGVATLALGAIGAMLTYKARECDRLGRWMGARSAAEMARLTAFQTIATEAAAKGPVVAGGALALLRTCLLDDQRSWLEMRARGHRRSSETTATWGGIATALAFVGGSGAVIASFQPDLTWVALSGVIGAAIGAYAVNREGMRRDRANADRYEKAATALDALASRFDAVEMEIVAGKADALTAYASAITEQLATEHKQWLEGTAQAESILAKLDANLHKPLNNADPETTS